MEAIHIQGCTRTIGASQGFIGLPLRDITVDDPVMGPDSAAMETAWAFSLDEVGLLNQGQPVILRIMGRHHPPVMLYVGREPRSALTQAARDVLTERERQVSAEGWSPDHDDAHNSGELALAAAAYANPFPLADAAVRLTSNGTRVPTHWPFDDDWWKPADRFNPRAGEAGRRRDLVKAAALLLAEIERIDRAAEARPE